MHAKFQQYVAALNHLYLKTPALFEQDGGWEGFQWIDPDNCDQSVISYRRIDKHGREVVVLINFTPVLRDNFRVGLPRHGVWEEIFNSDSASFGGKNCLNEGELHTERVPMHGLAQSVKLTLPPLGAVMLSCRRRFPQKRITKEKKQ
jgi:1,4-alpha-glucan branching enzyme